MNPTARNKSKRKEGDSEEEDDEDEESEDRDEDEEGEDDDGKKVKKAFEDEVCCSSMFELCYNKCEQVH